MKYPQYTVNGKKFGTDYETANMYWKIHGGVLMEKIDHMTPSHVLQKKENIRNCTHCGKLLEKGKGHLVPPCFGDPGIWICEREK